MIDVEWGLALNLPVVAQSIAWCHGSRAMDVEGKMLRGVCWHKSRELHLVAGMKFEFRKELQGKLKRGERDRTSV